MTCRQRALAIPLAAFLLAGSTGCQAVVDRLKANWAVKQGNDFYKAQDFIKAVQWYRYGTYLNPDLPIAYYNTALAYIALYKTGSRHPKDLRYSQEAIDNLERFLYYNPDHDEAKDYLLSVFIGSERFDEAAAFFEKEFKERATDPAVASKLTQRLGMIYAKKGDFESALEWYKKRADIEKDNAEALYMIGYLCWEKVYKQGTTIELDRRQELIEMGLDYLTRAQQLRENYFEAVLYVNLLYREKAKVAMTVGDIESAAKFTQEADKNQKLALEMRKKVQAGK